MKSKLYIYWNVKIEYLITKRPSLGFDIFTFYITVRYPILGIVLISES